jgi:hypothetical protein
MAKFLGLDKFYIITAVSLTHPLKLFEIGLSHFRYKMPLFPLSRLFLPVFGENPARNLANIKSIYLKQSEAEIVI